MIVPDATCDQLFSENPLVTGAPAIRFYAGYPLISPEGQPLGAICIIDTKPREGLDDAQAEALETLAEVVRSILEGIRVDVHSRAAQTHSLQHGRRTRAALRGPGQFIAAIGVVDPPRWSIGLLQQTVVRIHRSSARGQLWHRVARFPPSRRSPAVALRWDQSVKSSDDYEIRYRLRRHDGDYRWVVARGHPLNDRPWQGDPMDRDLYRHQRRNGGGRLDGIAVTGTQPPHQEHLRSHRRIDFAEFSQSSRRFGFCSRALWPRARPGSGACVHWHPREGAGRQPRPRPRGNALTNCWSLTRTAAPSGSVSAAMTLPSTIVPPHRSPSYFMNWQPTPPNTVRSPTRRVPSRFAGSTRPGIMTWIETGIETSGKPSEHRIRFAADRDEHRTSVER